MSESIHKTVLLQETIDGLHLHKGALVVDATLGGGGHSLEICRRYPNVKIIALDQDKHALEVFKEKSKDLKRDVTLINENFRNIDKVLKKDLPAQAGGIGKVDGIIFDLGLSSDQLEDSDRGFSFMKSGPLSMTMKESLRSEDVTAFDVVNTWSEKVLADVIYGYGEERFSRRIAKGIIEARGKKEIKTTGELVEVIRDAVPSRYRNGKLHFATKTFQAIRIAVNDELGALTEGLTHGFVSLKTGGRMSVISFHSLEDRIVKRFYKKKVDEGEASLIPAISVVSSTSGRNKKIIKASEDEIKNNSRSRSAKLRIIEKIK